MNKNKTVIVDIDDVLRPTTRAMIQVINKYYDRNDKMEDIDHFGFYKDKLYLNNKHVSIKEFFEMHGSEVMDIEPYMNARNALDKLSENNFRVILASAQFKGLEMITANWIDKHKFNYDSMYFGNDKKNDINGGYRIDDVTKNLYKGCNNILISKPWNIKDKHYCRAYTVNEAVDYILHREGLYIPNSEGLK